MEIKDYPAVIESSARQLAQLETNIASLRLLLNNAELEADIGIAFDNELKNEQQRKARRAELLRKDDRYTETQKLLAETLQHRGYTQARLEALRSELEILKGVKPEQPLDLAAKSTHCLVVRINPEAQFDWERVQFQDPVTRDLPDLKNLVAEMVGDSGNYLIQLELAVKVLSA